MKGSRDIWVLVILFVMLVVVLQFVARPGQEENTVSSSYNADPQGTKAFYTLLKDRLGYNVQRLRVGFDKMPANAKVVILVEPKGSWVDGPLAPKDAVNGDQQEALTEWIEKGGTFILASSKLSGAPEEFRQNGGLGKGQVRVFGLPNKLTNKGMRDNRNAVDMAALAASHATKDDLILFDEFHHGYSESESALGLIGRPVKMSLFVFALALLLAAYSRGRRFGAVRSAPETEAMRPGSEFVEAVGRLYRRAGATDVAVDVMTDSLLHRLSAKLGVPADQVVSRVHSMAGSDVAERMEKLMSARNQALAGTKPTERELLEITREVQQMEKELGLERNRN